MAGAGRRVALGGLVAVLVAGGCSGDGETAGSTKEREAVTTTTAPPPEPVLSARSEPLPVVTPTPRDMRWLGDDVAVPTAVTVTLADGVDDGTRTAVREALAAAGASDVDVQVAGAGSETRGQPDDRGGRDSGRRLTVSVGSLADPETVATLADVGLAVVPADLGDEGYALAAFRQSDGHDRVVLAGAGPDGTFYAAQTLRQLAGDGVVAGVGVIDRPAMAHRGVIEGFYGSPWTPAERLDQLAFYGRFKLNTYIYAPKDDPFHRDRWREPYPADQVAGLSALVEEAQANHVRFTFAVSPGVSICYGDPDDRAALVAKLDAMYSLGVRSFSVALDDIDHTRWNCPGDAALYGAPSTGAAARAQADLLNAVQHDFIATHDGARPLQMVPTEYRGTRDSEYRQQLRALLDPAVEVMWTGAYVVPDQITVAHAQAADAAFGRPVFVWDNTPVNDFPRTTGRLILAPYSRREPGLSGQVTGVVLNPMNQASASKVQLVGGADFAWNDAAYDPARAQRAAADDLAGGDAATVDALLAFFDLENLAPTSARSGIVSQPQAPALAAQLDGFRATWRSGDRAGAVAGLRPYAERMAGAPALIRAHVVDPAFAADCGPWLDATALWGQALVATLDGLAARAGGDPTTGEAKLAEAASLAAQAEAIQTIPGETKPQGPVRVGDGVLDTFVRGAPALA
ncbi:MAG TPA: beta-N-acetylglucosaminidase domain-containing protein [Acidimicrobiales bacterium]|jgi:hyaluronoglucosaminidase